MAPAELINPSPLLHERRDTQRQPKKKGEELDAGDIFELIRDIQDPEHPYSLERLNVVQEDLIELDNDKKICTCVVSLSESAWSVVQPAERSPGYSLTDPCAECSSHQPSTTAASPP